MQKQLNLKVKYRESFRPFAPSVLYEDVNEWFEHETSSPYMLIVAKVKAIPGTAVPERISSWKYISLPNLNKRSINPLISVYIAPSEVTLFQIMPRRKTAVTGGAIYDWTFWRYWYITPPPILSIMGIQIIPNKTMTNVAILPIFIRDFSDISGLIFL